MLGSATAFQGATLRSGAATRSAVSMAVEDLVGGINDPIFGGTPEGKVFDPLGLGADEAALYRRRVVEIKHGRICMIAFLGMTVGPNDVRCAPTLTPAPCSSTASPAHQTALTPPFPPTLIDASRSLGRLPSQLIAPTHQLLSPSLDLHFDDIPGGIQAIGAVPGAGWAQIIAVVGIHELTINKQDYTKTPGEIPTFLGFKPEDPEVRPCR